MAVLYPQLKILGHSGRIFLHVTVKIRSNFFLLQFLSHLTESYSILKKKISTLRLGVGAGVGLEAEETVLAG
jgi:hypothetical protein